MKKIFLAKEILQLNRAIESCYTKLAEVEEKKERLNAVMYAGNRQKLYRELPLKYADTVFSTRKQRLRTEVSYTLQKELFCCPISGAELAVNGEKIAVLCQKCVETDEGVVFTFLDPYGFFYSKPMKLPYDEAIGYLHRVVYVTISSCSEDGMSYTDRFYKELEKGKHYGEFFEKDAYVQNLYQVNGIVHSEFGLYGEYGKERDLVSSTIVRYAMRHREVENERVAVDAITDIQNYAHVTDEYLLVRRLSPTEVRVIGNDGRMYSFFFKAGLLFFIEEPGHGATMQDKVEVPLDYQYAMEFRSESRRDFNELMDEFRNMSNEQKELYAEHIRERREEQRFEYNIDVICREVNEEGRRLIKKEVDMWRKHRVMFEELKNIEVDDLDVLRMKKDSKRKLLAERERLQEQYQHLCLCVKDHWYYFKLYIKYQCNNLEEAVGGDKAGQIIYVDGRKGWHINLIHHPEYYVKWRGTFFDEQHRFVSERIVSYNRKCEGRYLCVEDRLSEHYYNTIYGDKSKWEDLSEPNRGMGIVRKLTGTSVGDDKVCYYVGYCDASSYDEGGVSLHIIDPYTEVSFGGMNIEPELALKAVGRMCVVGYAYNFYDESARFLELQILPYTLTEKMGEYEKDTVVHCNEDIVLVGRAHNSLAETGFVLL